MSKIILPHEAAKEEVVDLESIGPALGAMLGNQKVALIQIVFSISRITGQSPQEVLAQSLAECDVTDEIWENEPKVRRLKPEEIVVPNRAMRREEARKR